MKKYLYIVAYLVLCAVSVQAFNLSPFTWKLRSRDNAADSAFIRNDTMFINNMSVSVAAILKAVALQADTLRGSSNIVGILDSALRIDPDSSSAVNVITFGGYGGGLRWNRATDKVQFTNDFSTWTDIGSGGSGSAGAEIHDSLDANWATFTAGGGTDQDSTFNAHRSQRWLPHPSLTGQYIGASTDSGFAEHVDSTSGNSYTRYWTPIWYWEIVPDSALPTWGRVEAAIAANGGGDITGVIANDWLTGSASSGDVSLGIDPDLLAAIYLEADTTVIEGTAVKIRNNDGVTEIKLDNDTVLVQNLNSGSIIFNVFGTPTDHNELVIKENQVIIGSGVTLSGYTETGDISNVGVTAPITGGGSSGSVTIAFDWTWLYGFVDTTTASIPVATLANSVLYSWLYTTIDTSSATVLSVAMGNGGTGGGSNGALTLNVVGSDEIAVTADSIYVADSKIKSVHLEDGTIALADMGSNSVDSTKIVDASIGSGDIGTGRITTTHLLDGTVALADHAANSVDSTKIVDASIGSGDIGTGRITTTHILDGTIALADHASNSVDSTKIVDASIGSGDIGTGRITTTHILDATIAKADLGTDLNRKIVPLKYIASQDHALEDNIILSLEGFDKADSTFYMFRDSSAAAGSDTIMLGCTLPSNITQADTLILIYKSSSGTTSTSKIDEVMLWVTSGQGVTLRTRDFSDATDKASSSRAKITYSLSTDGDFNEEEQVTLRIITAYGSASQFVKLYQAYLICR